MIYMYNLKAIKNTIRANEFSNGTGLKKNSENAYLLTMAI